MHAKHAFTHTCSKHAYTHMHAKHAYMHTHLIIHMKMEKEKSPPDHILWFKSSKAPSQRVGLSYGLKGPTLCVVLHTTHPTYNTALYSPTYNAAPLLPTPRFSQPTASSPTQLSQQIPALLAIASSRLRTDTLRLLFPFQSHFAHFFHLLYKHQVNEALPDHIHCL